MNEGRPGAGQRKQATVEDLKTGPNEPRSAVLTAAEEAMIVGETLRALPGA